MFNKLEAGGYTVPEIWARNGDKVAEKEITIRKKLGLPLGGWTGYLKGFQKILRGED